MCNYKHAANEILQLASKFWRFLFWETLSTTTAERVFFHGSARQYTESREIFVLKEKECALIIFYSILSRVFRSRLHSLVERGENFFFLTCPSKALFSFLGWADRSAGLIWPWIWCLIVFNILTIVLKQKNVTKGTIVL